MIEKLQWIADKFAESMDKCNNEKKQGWHLEFALDRFNTIKGRDTSYIELSGFDFITGKSSTVSFKLQSDPIKKDRVNGIQASDMIIFVQGLFASLNEAFPCDENTKTIEALQTAIDWQEKRTADREKRNVEGLNKL